MYAMVQIVKLVPGSEEKMDELISEASERNSKQKGFKGVVFFKSDKRNEFGAIGIWETKEDHDAHYAAYSSEEIEFMQSSTAEVVVQGGYRVIDLTPFILLSSKRTGGV